MLLFLKKKKQKDFCQFWIEAVATMPLIPIVVDFEGQVRRKQFFFEKKNQKTFARLVCAANATGTH
jgi:hypothetical protein